MKLLLISNSTNAGESYLQHSIGQIGKFLKPSVDPVGLYSCNLVPFQINPHYLDAHPEGHAGETREQRIEEFIELNPDIYVVGLREGTMLEIHNRVIKLIGPRPARIFRKGDAPREIGPGDDLSFLL